MSAWGNKDDIASPGTVDLTGLAVANSAGVPTFFANNFAAGQVINITGAGSAVIASITDEGNLTLVSNTEITVGSITGAQYTVSEKPSYVVDTDGLIDAADVYGVDTTEAAFTTVKVTAVAVANAGTGYTNNQVVVVVGGTGTAANATVTTLNNSTAVDSLTLGQGGRYTVAPDATVRTTGGTGAGLRIALTTATTGANVAHAGWVHRDDIYTDSNGNRREKTEVLVAMSTITSDAADDGPFPEA